MKAYNLRYPHNSHSICKKCGLGCGILLHRDRNGSFLVEGDRDHPLSEGNLCPHGQDLNQDINKPLQRIAHPQVRYNRNMTLQSVSLEKALERIVAVIKTFTTKYGADSFAFYTSQKLSNEEYFILRKILKKLGSANLYGDGLLSEILSPDFLSSFNASIPFATAGDLTKSDCVLIASNVAQTHPILWQKILSLKTSQPHFKVIAIGTNSTPVAEMADISLSVLPGTEVMLFKTISKIIIESGNAYQIRYNQESGKSPLGNTRDPDVQEVAERCGVSTYLIQKVTEFIGQSHCFVSIWSEGPELYRSQNTKEILQALFSLHLLTGQLGKPGSGPMVLPQAANGRGFLEIEKIFNSDIQKERARLNPITKNINHSRSRENLIKKMISGDIKALWIIDTDLFETYPDRARVEKALQRSKFVIFQGSDPKREILNYADAVLPSPSVFERKGTHFNALGGLAYTPQAIVPSEETYSVLDILSTFARKMDFSGFEYENTEVVFSEYILAFEDQFENTPDINYRKLTEAKVCYPQQKQRAILSPRDVAYPVFLSDPIVPEAVNGRCKYDMIYPFLFEVALFTGCNYPRYLFSPKVFDQNSKNTFLVINPLDAEALEIRQNELAEISSVLGKANAKTVLSEFIKPGSVYIYLNISDISQSDLEDWTTLLGGFQTQNKHVLKGLHIQKFKKKQQKIVIIGAGAAAYGFVKSYREINQTDIIEIFSKEKTPFYDRYLLPEYLSGAQAWDQLLKIKPEEEASLNLIIHRGVSVLKIDREAKLVTDSKNKITAYDILIIATGSRAAVPKNTPKKGGIFTMRSRNDAENFRSKVPPNAEVVIVGGGILGLEVAASLREKGAGVTIIQRTSRFLDRQLDVLGSQLLHEEMKDIGCEIYYNDEVQLYFGQTTITGVGLKSGRRINCQAMIIAIGNLPNTHLAKDANLHVKVGIAVDDRLQTEDTNIFALGEIAEVNGKLYNFPEAAEEQAFSAAHLINGDKNSCYRGSLLKNVIKLQGFDLCSMGMVETPDDEAYEEILLIDKKKRYYKKCIIHDDRLVGTILIGDRREFETFAMLIANNTPLKEKRAYLLKPHPVASANTTENLQNNQIKNPIRMPLDSEKDEPSESFFDVCKSYKSNVDPIEKWSF